MQSHLEAALLGHSSSNLNTPPNIEEDENNFQDDETEELEDFIDEECDGEVLQRIGKQSNSSNSRTVTLQNLLSAGILQPGYGAMSIEYLGQKFVGDLLEDGKIRSQETDIVFASPSAWAIACKRFINPDKKSGCGWASVKYRGKKLDAFKNIWYKKKSYEESRIERLDIEIENLLNQKNMSNQMPYQRIVVKHNTIANRTLTHDANTLIECVPFSNLGKIQPFMVSLNTNAALLMDFHCHLTKTEVSGYLAGHWDVNAHNLQITHAFPCRNTKQDRDNAANVEAEIAKTIEKEKLLLVGWYHSHPFIAAAPTLRDVDAQLDYQIRMKGSSDNSYTPCIGIIVSPYNYENTSLESSIIAYWVIPPPETKPNEYGRPMLMSYSVIQDLVTTSSLKEEMTKCADYYKKEQDFINFNSRYLNNTLYIDKLKSTLISKFPRDESELALWKFVREILDCHLEENDNLLSIPNVNKPQLLPSLSNPNSLSSSLMLSSDISSLLFNAGKFSGGSNLFGLPDPMASSTLAANNMFLSTNLFKMQELLKPLSSSSPLPSKGKSDHKNTPLKIPTDLKITKADFNPEMINSKSKLDFITPDINLSKISSKSDYASDLSSSKNGKQEFSVPELSISKAANDYTLDLSKNFSDLSRSLLDYSRSYSSEGEKPPKIPRLDFSTLDLSVSKNIQESTLEAPTDLSLGTNEQNYNKISSLEDKPLNLAD